ncbi:MAG: hypothetical protein OES09_07460 [Gammaproteobacteria bacterium]|nr:hypothetical protein [Gammaproteobacteria bacterium]
MCESVVYRAPQSEHTRYGFKLYWESKLLPRISLPHAGQFIISGIGYLNRFLY